MNTRVQKRLAADILGTGISRVWIDPEELERVGSAITREEVRRLIHERVIRKKRQTGITRKLSLRRKGPGSRKGSRQTRKEVWIIRIRKIRKRLLELRDGKIITKPVFHKLWMMARGGSFRSLSHLNEYLESHKLLRRR